MMGPATHPPTSLELAARHVVYELRMWQWAAAQLRENGREQLDTPERNAIIESYLLHLRSLIEFFRSESLRSGDVAAVQYEPNWSVGNYASTLERAWASLNKRLSHITTERLNEEAWPVAQQSFQLAHDAVGVLWEKFDGLLDVERRSWFHPELSAS
jgi:hypothetical protein